MKENLVDVVIYALVAIGGVLTYMSLGYDFKMTIGYIAFGCLILFMLENILNELRL